MCSFRLPQLALSAAPTLSAAPSLLHIDANCKRTSSRSQEVLRRGLRSPCGRLSRPLSPRSTSHRSRAWSEAEGEVARDRQAAGCRNSLRHGQGHDGALESVPRERPKRSFSLSRVGYLLAEVSMSALVGFLDGSDGTRTRDLRRDRPVLVVPGWAGVGGDSRREQGLSSLVLRGLPGAGGSFRRPPAGWSRDAIVA
jgi:hypothetical protein